MCRLRGEIAARVGGDTHFRSAHQPIRVAGSVYHKGGFQRLVRIADPLVDILCIDPIRNLFDGGADGGRENDNAAMMFFLQERVPVLPSTCKCPQSGAALPVENPAVWVYPEVEA